MWLIVMKGLSGSGKSTLSRAVSEHFGWPLIDKDDVRDCLADEIPEVGGLAYDIMFRIARRQLLQGLSVICDSPLTASMSYDHAQVIAQEAQATLAIIECICSDELLWKRRITSRKALGLPAHHQTDWDRFQAYRRLYGSQASYPIFHPYLIVDTIKPIHECLNEVVAWLA
ncbi:AAA family ATPase [Dictyobacter aurantiacus]|uniref:ATP-binding protein n=1 Tax=Dictyobacter aurantiacus TaxID=1936993 RepID=A0A401ZQU1_9CHLR|nr:AAA family ATPase [Dictyobacter aurantiacus]GCE09126.1 ATP-binding protein [Dictyobacter aurantiacus]